VPSLRRLLWQCVRFSYRLRLYRGGCRFLFLCATYGADGDLLWSDVSRLATPRDSDGAAGNLGTVVAAIPGDAAVPDRQSLPRTGQTAHLY